MTKLNRLCYRSADLFDNRGTSSLSIPEICCRIHFLTVSLFPCSNTVVPFFDSSSGLALAARSRSIIFLDSNKNFWFIKKIYFLSYSTKSFSFLAAYINAVQPHPSCTLTLASSSINNLTASK